MPIEIHYRINLTASEQVTLKRLANRHTTAQAIVKRAKVILMANGEGASNQQIANHLGITKAKIVLWARRWIERAIEPIQERLIDAARLGRPEESHRSNGAKS